MTPRPLHEETDASIWAKEWAKVIKEHPEIPHDEGAMIGWFANAIMAGYDTAMRRARQDDHRD